MTSKRCSKQLLKTEHELKQIRGIGPALEQKLNQAGVFSLNHIACMSLEDLAGLFSDTPGLSAERISRMGWINQARKLVGNKDSGHETAIRKNRQHSELFSIDLLMDEYNNVRRTHILHVHTLNEISWAGWDQGKLASFILNNATPKIVPRDTKSIKKHTSRKSDQTGYEKKNIITGDFKLADAEIQSKLGMESNWLVPMNESFTVGLMVDLNKTSVHPSTPLQYRIEVYVKNLSNGSRQKIGEKKGGVKQINTFSLKINCNALPQGFYRLEACMILSPDLESPDLKTRLMAITPGQVLRVN